ncbi:DEAD/DEAH box helicase, partial [Reticulomyxa filosa]
MSEKNAEEEKRLSDLIGALNKEIIGIDMKISALQQERQDLEQEREQIELQLQKIVKMPKQKFKHLSDDTHTRKLTRYLVNFPWNEAIDKSLKETFHLNQFRSHQREILNCTLSGDDCFVIMPSGGGKSLCYQLPVTLPSDYVPIGFTVVVSPLLSLIQDQCHQLNKLGIRAVALSGTDKDKPENKEIYDAMSGRDTSEGTTGGLSKTKTNGKRSKKGGKAAGPPCPPKFQLVYLTPEKLIGKKVLNALEQAFKNNYLQRLIIDEAHCCSQWGHEFRPDYKKLCIFRKQFPTVPILACTATATQH